MTTKSQQPGMHCVSLLILCLTRISVFVVLLPHDRFCQLLQSHGMLGSSWVYLKMGYCTPNSKTDRHVFFSIILFVSIAMMARTQLVTVRLRHDIYVKVDPDDIPAIPIRAHRIPSKSSSCPPEIITELIRFPIFIDDTSQYSSFPHTLIQYIYIYT